MCRDFVGGSDELFDFEGSRAVPSLRLSALALAE